MNITKLFLTTSTRWYYPLRYFVLILIILAIYFQTFYFGFVFDDYEFIVDNPYIKNLNNIHYLWQLLPKTRLIGFYSFAFNYKINQLNPAGYHVFNVLVHFLATTLVWACARLLFRITKLLPSENRLTQELPFFIALLFLVHPCQTQAVSYITQRFESMGTVFYLASVYCYLRARTTSINLNKIILFISCSAFALIGIMTKEVVVTLPLMLLACEWILWPQGFITSSKNLFKKLTPWTTAILLGLAAFSFFVLFTKLVRTDLRIFFQTSSFLSESHDGDMLTVGNYLLTQLRVFLTFLRLLVLPINQNLDYDYPMSTGLLHPPLTLVGLCLITLIVFFIIKLRKQQPLVSFGLSWSLITFSINLAPRNNVIFEHKLYLISFGLILAIVSILSSNLRRQQRLLIFLLIGVTVIFSLLTFKRNHVWKNQMTLWEDVITKSPEKQRVWLNLGMVYLMTKDYDAAILTLNKAIVMQPLDFKSYVNRGMAYAASNLNNQALIDFNKAISIKPTHFIGYLRRSQIFKKQNQDKAALSDLNQAINLAPNFQYGYIERGFLNLEKGSHQKALNDFEKALTIAPFDTDAINGRAQIFFTKGQYDLAIKDISQSIKIDPTNSSVYKLRATVGFILENFLKLLKDWETPHT